MGYVVRKLFFALIICLVFISIFIVVQRFRIPELNPAYEKMLYADQEPIWEDNLYFSLAGLAAPVDVKNTYQYGQAESLTNFKKYEDLKRASGISYHYELPKNPELIALMDSFTEREPLKLKKEDWKNLACLYKVHEDQGQPCALQQDVQNYISENKILWDRFNHLPNYKLYRIPPMIFGGNVSGDMIGLAQLKSAQIIDLAEQGQFDAAFKEWFRYMMIYRSMANARESLIFKAVVTSVYRIHMFTLEKMLFLNPALATQYSSEIREVLMISDPSLFREEYMFSDDLGYMEATILSKIGNVNSVRNDAYDCLLEFQKHAELSAKEFPFGKEVDLCSLQKLTNIPSGVILYAVLTPGNVFSNATFSLIFPGIFKGQEIMSAMKQQEILSKMAMVGVQILEKKIPSNDVESFLQSLPATENNPITGKPFEWNKEKKALYFQAGEKLNEFHLNLK